MTLSWGYPGRNAVIESGIGRLGIPEFDTRDEMEEINETMLLRAADREGLCQRWEQSLKEIRGGMEVRQREDIPKEAANTG